VGEIDWAAVNGVLNVIGVILSLFIVWMFWKSAHNKADAKEILELAKANNQIALDLVSSMRRDARGLSLGMKMAAEEAAAKLKTEAAKVAAVKEGQTVHLPAGSELTVKAEPDGGAESQR
jgi:hypothetical protein